MGLYPFTFHPIFKERIWGGRKLEQLYGKALPSDVCIGESWEISDRPGDASVIANGPLKGKDLRWLMLHHGVELLGRAAEPQQKFPLLIKILDARQTLSLQIHPPALLATEMGSEAKTEMWYVAAAEPNARLYVGLKSGVTREVFERNIKAGTVDECFHQLYVQAGDAMFLPSGRVHALGAGLVIFEIQQNSDTTYRVFDWNRPGTDGKPRALHITESLRSIDFSDFEPELAYREKETETGTIPLVRDELFSVDLNKRAAPATLQLEPGVMRIIGVVRGQLEASAGGEKVELLAGQFCLLPASLPGTRLDTRTPATYLTIIVGAR